MTALRDAFLSAVVALGLFGPLVGLVTTNGDHGLSLTIRPVATAVVVGLVFFGRLRSWPGAVARAPNPPEPIAHLPNGSPEPGNMSRRSCWSPRSRCRSPDRATTSISAPWS